MRPMKQYGPLVIIVLVIVSCIVAVMRHGSSGSSLQAQMQEADQRDLTKASTSPSIFNAPAANPVQPVTTSPKIVSQFPLHMAAAQNDIPTLSRLLEQGSDVNARNDSQQTPLHVAAQNGALDAMKLLIEHHADVNARDFNNKTPMLSAINPPYQPMFGNDGRLLPIVTLLIDNGADVNACDLYNDCPLQSAYRNELLDTALLLLQKGANPNGHSQSGRLNTILDMVAAQTPDRFMNQFQQQISGEPTGRGNTWPSELKNPIAFAGLLIEKGANVNATEGIHGATPVMTAIDNKNYPMAEFLLSKGAVLDLKNDPAFRDKNMINPVDAAITNKDVDGVKFLLDHGAKPTTGKQGMPSLSFAALQGNLPIAELLIAHGANVNETMAYPDLRTPLMYAVSVHNLPIIQLLLAKGADPNAKSGFGDLTQTPMQLAIANRAPPEMISVLQQYGAK